MDGSTGATAVVCGFGRASRVSVDVGNRTCPRATVDRAAPRVALQDPRSRARGARCDAFVMRGSRRSHVVGTLGARPSPRYRGPDDDTQSEEPASMYRDDKLADVALDEPDPAFDMSMAILQYLVAATAVVAAILLAAVN
jgi:hypothetical protein